jgi:hypothetical protein
MSSKHWILLSLVLLVSSSYPYKKLSETHAAAFTRVQNAQAKVKKEEATVRQVEADLSQASTSTITDEPRQLVQFYQDFSYGLRDIAMRYKVDVQSIAPRTGSRGTGAKDINAITTSLPASPGVKVLSIEVQGRFRDDVQLKQLLDFLRDQKISIGGLNIRRDAFVLQLDVFGV